MHSLPARYAAITRTTTPLCCTCTIIKINLAKYILLSRYYHISYFNLTQKSFFPKVWKFYSEPFQMSHSIPEWSQDAIKKREALSFLLLFFNSSGVTLFFSTIKENANYFWKKMMLFCFQCLQLAMLTVDSWANCRFGNILCWGEPLDPKSINAINRTERSVLGIRMISPTNSQYLI